MKKIISLSVLLTLFVFLSAPILVLAADEEIPNCCKVSRTLIVDSVTYTKGNTVGGETTCNLGITGATHQQTKNWGLVCLLSSIGVIADWIFTFSMAIVIIFVVMGAFILVTSVGDAQKITKGRNYILYAAIGMVIALLAKAVPALVRNLIG